MPEEEKEAKDPQASEEEAGPPEPDLPSQEELLQAHAALLEAIEGMVATFKEVGEIMRDTASAMGGLAAVEVPSTADLSLYRTVTAARGVQEVNMLLSQGWDYISGEYCEEIRKRRGMGGQQSVIAWTLYATMGKRDPMAETDRAALAADEERQAWERGVPVESVDAGGEMPAAAEENAPQGEVPVGAAARGRRVTAASPGAAGYEGQGGLANR